MKFEHTQVFNFDGALRGMRNPLESWSKSDSSVQYGRPDNEWTVQQYQQDGIGFVIGPNDMNLAQRLIKGGSEHRKFLRQIFVCVDITAPLYWYKELDTYKIGTVANSTSTMHKIMSKPFSLDMFEIDDFDEVEMADFEKELRICNKYRNLYLEYKDIGWDETAKKCWKALIRILPESWLQTRTITMNYKVSDIDHSLTNNTFTAKINNVVKDNQVVSVTESYKKASSNNLPEGDLLITPEQSLLKNSNSTTRNLLSQ